MGLTEKIQSLTTKANQKTGQQDTTLFDAVDTLIDGYDRIPEGYVEPIGTLDIGEDGEHNVKNYEKVNVHTNLQSVTVNPSEHWNVILPEQSSNAIDGFSEIYVNPIPSEYVKPTGTLDVGEKGVHDVTEYANVNVRVELENLDITPSTEEQQFYPDMYSDPTITGFYGVKVNPIPSEYIIPTGTKTINITENGTVTEDVTNYATAQITTNVVNQDYEDALVAFGVTEDLADSIEAMTTYSNEVTGESDTTLSDAVRTLTDGYGGGGFEYEKGTYIPTKSEQPIIYFTNTHSTAPSIIVFEDVSAETATISETDAFIYVNSLSLFGAPLLIKADTYYNEYVAHIKKNTNGNVTSEIGPYTRGEITASSFIPYAATNYNYPAGHTLKWIAVWKSSQSSPTPSGPDYDDVTLPAEYQRVDYIESTGTQYIDIPIGFYPTDEVHTVCGINQRVSDEASIILCYPYNDNNNRYALCAIRGQRYEIAFGSVSSASTNTPVVNDGNMHNWEYKNRIFTSVDAMASVGVGGISFGERAKGTRLFYGFYDSSSGKIRYYVHKTEDNTSVALYACYRKADGVIGMYDVDNDIFYTNDGSGTFGKGADI